MEKIKLEILGLSSSQSQIGSFALVLGEEYGNRRLPIIIGTYEAQAIALEIENIKPNRPMTHDLILSITRTFDIELEEVIISDLKEGVFYSRLKMYIQDEAREIDARPSDAIAIAVRYKAPIYTYEFILQEAGIIIKEEESESSQTEGESPSGSEETSRPSSQEIESGNMSKAQLVRLLNDKIHEAIQQENYEEAARLRDEIKKIENQT